MKKKFVKKAATGLFSLMMILTLTLGSISTSFAEEKESAKDLPSFKDVKSTDWFYNDVMNFAQYEFMKGNNGYFNPYGTLTRAEFAQIYFNIENFMGIADLAIELNGGVKGLKSNFQDVKSNDWFYKPVNYLANHGLIKGTAPNKFSPQAKITKEEVCTLLYRIAEDETKSEHWVTKLHQGDKKVNLNGVSPYAREAMTLLGSHGIVKEDKNGSLNAKNPISRAEAAVICNQFWRLYFEEDKIVEHIHALFVPEDADKENAIDKKFSNKLVTTEDIAYAYVIEDTNRKVYALTPEGKLSVMKKLGIKVSKDHYSFGVEYDDYTIVTAEAYNNDDNEEHLWIENGKVKETSPLEVNNVTYKTADDLISFFFAEKTSAEKVGKTLADFGAKGIYFVGEESI